MLQLWRHEFLEGGGGEGWKGETAHFISASVFSAFEIGFVLFSDLSPVISFPISASRPTSGVHLP